MAPQLRILQGLNDRFLLIREVERAGLRRLLYAGAGFIALKYAKARLGGKTDEAAQLKKRA
jgi:hypothetical protein